MFKKLFPIALMVFALFSCKKAPIDDIVPVASISLNQSEAEMLVGETLPLQAQISPSNATEKEVMWGSSKQSVATVSDAGLVTAVGEGSSKITATAGGKTATCVVTVTKPEVPVVHVGSVTLDKTDASLEIGQSLTLTATVLPENAADKSVEWKSTNPAIAEVDQNGTVTAISSGAVTITVTTNDGEKAAACEITVNAAVPPVPEDEYDGEENGHYWVDMGLPSGIKWATCNVGANYSSQRGSRFAWGETFARENVENPPYTWFNSATGKFTKYVIDSRYGNVDNLTTLESGDDAAHVQWGGDWRIPTAADVMELVENSTYESVQQNGVLGIKLTSKNNGHSIFLPGNNDGSLDGVYMTSSIFDTQTSWVYTFYDESIYPYDTGANRGGIFPVRAVIGTTTYIPVQKLDIEYTSAPMILGSTRTLHAWAVPDNATNNTVIWTSLDESVATVDDKGNVTAVGAGYAYIKASAGGHSDTFCFEVVPLLESIKIEPEELTLEIGESATVTVACTPLEYLKYYSPGYANRNDAVIDVECIGGYNYNYYSTDPPTFRITAKAGGEATFDYFATVNGEVTVVTCHVTVPYVEDDYDGETDGHKWVDLGLPSGIKWATCNIGTDYSTQVGPLLEWGEGENDPVKVNWGGDWRMPTEADAQELRDNTTYEWISYHGVPGAKFTSKINGKSIFLAADERYYGIYLTSSNYNGYVTCINFLDDGGLGINSVWQDNKHPIRPVIGNPPYVPVESVDFGYSHEFLSVGDVRYLDVDISPSNATNKKVTWSSTNESVAVVDSYGKLTCVGAGGALIYAEADGKTDYIILRVDPHINSITLDPAVLNLTVGQTAIVTVTIDPDVPLGSYGFGYSGGVFEAEAFGDNPIQIRVTALAEGTETFTFSAYGAQATGTVTVTAAKASTLAELKQMADAGQDCSSYLGYVFTTSGKIFKDAASIPSDGGSPVAMIAYIGAKGSADSSLGSSKYNGLAIALRNAASMNWGRKDNAYLDTPEFTNCNNISAALADMAGIGHTNIMSERYYGTADATYNYVVSGFNPSDLGCSGWFVPTAGQWAKYLNAMYGHTWSNFGEPDQYQYGVNFCAAIDNDIIAAGGASLFTYHSGNNAYYWTSSEVDNLSAIQMGFTYDAYQGREYFYAASKENAFQLRCFIAF